MKGQFTVEYDGFSRWQNFFIPILADKYWINTGNRRYLCLLPLIWNGSHLMIFPLELLRTTIGFSADPSSSKGKIVRWETTTNFSNNKQMSLIRCVNQCSIYLLELLHVVNITYALCTFKKIAALYSVLS